MVRPAPTDPVEKSENRTKVLNLRPPLTVVIIKVASSNALDVRNITARVGGGADDFTGVAVLLYV